MVEDAKGHNLASQSVWEVVSVSLLLTLSSTINICVSLYEKHGTGVFDSKKNLALILESIPYELSAEW